MVEVVEVGALARPRTDTTEGILAALVVALLGLLSPLAELAELAEQRESPGTWATTPAAVLVVVVPDSQRISPASARPLSFGTQFRDGH